MYNANTFLFRYQTYIPYNFSTYTCICCRNNIEMATSGYYTHREHTASLEMSYIYNGK